MGLAFLSAVPLFITGRLNRAIRYVLVANAFVGAALLAGFAFGSPAIGLVFLTTMSALLTCADVLLIIFFKKLM